MHLEFRLRKQSLNKRWDLFAHKTPLILNSTNWLTMAVESTGPRLATPPLVTRKQLHSSSLLPLPQKEDNMLFPHLYCLKFVSLQNRIKNKVRCCFALNTLATPSLTTVPIPTWNCNYTVTSSSSATWDAVRQEFFSLSDWIYHRSQLQKNKTKKQRRKQKKTTNNNNKNPYLNLDSSVEPRIQRWR